MPFNFLPLVLGAGDALGGFLAKQEADDAANDAARILTEGQQAAIGPSLAAAQTASEQRAQAAIEGRGDVTAGADEAIDANTQALERSLDFIDPELVAARGASNLLNDALGVNGPEAQAAFFQNFEDDPGFQAELQDRISAIDRSASSQGLLLSGRTLKAVGDEGQRFRRGAFTDRLNRLTTAAAPAREIAGRGAQLVTGAGSRVGDIAQSRGTQLANLRVKQGEAVAGGAEARGGIQASQALNLADIGANRRLTRGANQTRFIDTLTTAGGTALAGADFGPSFTAKPFLARQQPRTGATK